MEYKINLGRWNGVFAVPAAVADEYIKLAGADNLKVLLYCLRHAGADISDGEIARATGVKQESVRTSMEFWEQRGLFAESEKAAGANVTVSGGVRKIEAYRDPEYAPSEISEIIKEDKTIKYIFEQIENKKGKVTHTVGKTLTQIIEYYSMKPEVLLMLVEYCFSKNKFTPSYLKTVALDWLDNGINSVDSAERKIRELNEAEKEKLDDREQPKPVKKSRKASFDLDELDRQIMEEYGDG